MADLENGVICLSIIVRHVSGPPPPPPCTPPPHDPLKLTFFEFLFVFFQMEHVAIAGNWT